MHTNFYTFINEANMKWTKEKLQEEADKYQTREKFRKIGSGIEILTKEYCKNLAKLCKSRNDFCIKYNGPYRKSLKNEWINEFFPIEKITKEHCYNSAKLCKSRYDFSNKYQRLYYKSLKNGWIDEFFPKKLINLNNKRSYKK